MEDNNPFTDPVLVNGYENWYETTGRRADRLEKMLLGRLLFDFPQACTLVEMGCGTGHFTRWFGSQGLRPVGVDISTPMLKKAVQRSDVPYLQGNVVSSPLASDSFDLAALITTLEFLSDPLQGLTEAFRVARQGLILGVLNRWSRLGKLLNKTEISPWDKVHLFTPKELIRLIRQAACGRRIQITWRTTLFPVLPIVLPFPGGGFIGMSVHIAKRNPG